MTGRDAPRDGRHLHSVRREHGAVADEVVAVLVLAGEVSADDG